MVTRKYLIRFAWSIFLAIVCLIELGSQPVLAAMTMPEQFKSSEAAVILGLDKDPALDKKDAKLTKEMVKKAYRKLISKYHPDKFGRVDKEDEKVLRDIAQRINSAFDTLNKWLEVNPDYNPKHQNGSGSANQSAFHAGESSANGNDFSWEDLFKNRRSAPGGAQSSRWSSSSTDIVSESHYGGTSMRGTLFESLASLRPFEQAFLPMELSSTNVDKRLDALFVIDPAIFPQVEIKIISKNRDGSSPQLVDSMIGQYVRGHHRNGGGGYSDGIVFPNRNYLMSMGRGQTNPTFTSTPVDEAGKNVMLKVQQGGFMLIEMNPSGHSAGQAFLWKNAASPEDVLPKKRPVVESKPVVAEQLEDWRTLQLPKNESVIRLGYTPSAQPKEEASSSVTTKETPPSREKVTELKPRVVSAPELNKPREIKFGVAMPPHLDAGSKDIIASALELVKIAAPSGVTLVPSKTAPFDFILEVTDSAKADRDLAIQHAQAQGTRLSSSADAYTMAIENHPDSPQVVRLLWDKVGFENHGGKWVERPDAFSRIVAALGHEIYGNVRSFMDSHEIFSNPGFRYSKEVVQKEQAKSEVKAFRAGMQTLERLIKFAEDKGFPRKIVADLRSALVREEAGLQSWEKRAAQLGVSMGTVVDMNCLRNRMLGKTD
jgi:hypothetical protein